VSGSESGNRRRVSGALLKVLKEKLFERLPHMQEVAGSSRAATTIGNTVLFDVSRILATWRLSSLE